MSVETLPAPLPLNAGKAGFFRFREVGGKVLVTNDLGRHRVFTPKRFRRFAAGEIGPDDPDYRGLCEDGFVRDRMDFEALSRAWARRHSYLWEGPNLHIVVVTLRCDHRCVYCHAGSARLQDRGTDMSPETASAVLDRIFSSPSKSLTIEFQGGEPLVNWPVVRHIVEEARARAEKQGRVVWLNLVTNLSLMDEDKLEWLLERGVNFCTSLDGPADLHDRNRPRPGGGGYANAAKWYREINRRTRGKAFRIDALLTVTRASLGRAREIVDSYAELGARSLFLRPLNPYGTATAAWPRIGYGAEDFLAFYERALDRVLEVNRAHPGRRPFVEQTARLFLDKILTDRDPNYLDLRSPCGAGIGQIAYNWDGGVYTCDEGRMLARMGDDTFRLGRAGETSYADDVSHPTVRAMAVASCLDAQPLCSDCAYKPYCGACPVQCYREQGDIMGRMAENTRCRINKGVLDMIFVRLQDPANEKIFRRWLKRRPDLCGEASYRRS